MLPDHRTLKSFGAVSNQLELQLVVGQEVYPVTDTRNLGQILTAIDRAELTPVVVI